MTLKNIKYFIYTISVYFLFFTTLVFAKPPYTGLICINNSKNIKLEFFFMEKEENYIRVFKRVSGKFMDVGQVVGQKPGSFSLWEDKHAYQGVDFAWHLDKITGNLSPFILSQSLKQVKSLPQKLSCRSESFWY